MFHVGLSSSNYVVVYVNLFCSCPSFDDLGVSNPLLNNFPSIEFPFCIQALTIDMKVNNLLSNKLPCAQFLIHV